MPELPTRSDPQTFYAQVWNIVVRIPRGKVASYGQIAKMLRPPAGVDEATFAEFGGDAVVRNAGFGTDHPELIVAYITEDARRDGN